MRLSWSVKASNRASRSDSASLSARVTPTTRTAHGMSSPEKKDSAPSTPPTPAVSTTTSLPSDAGTTTSAFPFKMTHTSCAMSPASNRRTPSIRTASCIRAVSAVRNRFRCPLNCWSSRALISLQLASDRISSYMSLVSASSGTRDSTGRWRRLRALAVRKDGSLSSKSAELTQLGRQVVGLGVSVQRPQLAPVKGAVLLALGGEERDGADDPCGDGQVEQHVARPEQPLLDAGG
eukprot:scaffold3466_cov132-Isochrysis_galbana.AAC.5